MYPAPGPTFFTAQTISPIRSAAPPGNSVKSTSNSTHGRIVRRITNCT